MKKILISVTNTGWIHKFVTSAIIRILQNSPYKIKVIFPTHNPYENNLHHIVNEFMEDNYDFWLNIDSDNPPIGNPLELVELNKDILGLPTPVWHFTGDKKGERPVYWNGYDYVPEKDAYKEHLPRQGLQEVDAVGTGCLLISRRVFENLEMRKSPFQRQYNEDGTVSKGNDISFCEKAKKQGFKIYCHYGYPCLHFNELEINDVIKAFRNLYEKEEN